MRRTSGRLGAVNAPPDNASHAPRSEHQPASHDTHAPRSPEAAEARIGPFTLSRLALGDWNEVVRDPIDALRATLLVGAFAMAVAGDYGAATRLTLTFVAVLLARALDPPRTIDLAFTAGMLLQGWGNALELFDLWPWYSKVVHYVLPFGGSAILYMLLARLDVVHEPRSPLHRAPDGRHHRRDAHTRLHRRSRRRPVGSGHRSKRSPTTQAT